MIRKTRCTRCAREFVFDTTAAPSQRAGTRGSAAWRRVVAYYPNCSFCQETVEVAEVPGAYPQSRVPDRPAAS